MNPDRPPPRLGPKGLPYRPCVGVVLLNAAGHVFAGRRVDYPGEAWQMPQGGIDTGETPRAAALRELAEETGIAPDLVTIEAETSDWLSYDLPPDLLGRVWQGRYCGQIQKWFLMRFHGADDAIDITAEPAEFDRWAWLPAKQILDHIVAFKREAYQQIFAEFAPYLP